MEIRRADDYIKALDKYIKEPTQKFKLRFIADDDATRSKGLMHSRPLQPSEAALFVFDKPGAYGFWNKNVSYPIDIVFMDEDMQVVDIANLQENQLEGVYPKKNCKFVLEIPTGHCSKCDIKPGRRMITNMSECHFE